VLYHEIDAKKNAKLSHNALWDETIIKKKAIVCNTHGKKSVKRSNVYSNVAKKVVGVRNKVDNKATKEQQSRSKKTMSIGGRDNTTQKQNL
jgi:hypothetical protein